MTVTLTGLPIKMMMKIMNEVERELFFKNFFNFIIS